MKHHRERRFLSPIWLLILLIMVVFSACWPQEYVPSGPVVFSHDSWVKDASTGGPEVEITGFKWRYLNQTDQIKLWGDAVNKGAAPLQSIRIIIDAFDQYNYLLGTSETYLSPTYIEPGAAANFEFFLPRGQWVEHIRLRYRIESRID